MCIYIYIERKRERKRETFGLISFFSLFFISFWGPSLFLGGAQNYVCVCVCVCKKILFYTEKSRYLRRAHVFSPLINEGHHFSFFFPLHFPPFFWGGSSYIDLRAGQRVYGKDAHRLYSKDAPCVGAQVPLRAGHA